MEQTAFSGKSEFPVKILRSIRPSPPFLLGPGRSVSRKPRNFFGLQSSFSYEPEPQLIFNLILAELISSNLLYSFESRKYGMLCHYQLRPSLVYPPSKENFLISSVNFMKRPTLLCLYSFVTVCLKISLNTMSLLVLQS